MTASLPTASASCCPACGTSGDMPVAAEMKGVSFLRCENCTHQFALFQPSESHLQTVYGNSYFKGSGSNADGYADYLAEEDHRVERGRHYARIVAEFSKVGRLLDVGCGAGFFMSGLQESGWECEGIEPNAKMAEVASEKGFVVHQGGFETASEIEGPFDLILMIQVAAHFSSPHAAFARASELLKPGGHLVVETWDGSSLFAKLLKNRWHEYNPPSVLNIFTKKSLRLLVERKGLEELTSQRTIKTVAAGHVANRLGSESASILSRIAAKLFRILPPTYCLPYLADDLFYAVFAKPSTSAAQ